MRPTVIEKPIPRANLLRIDAPRHEPAAALQLAPQPGFLPPLMTSARRIALDALEREFADSLRFDLG